MVFISKLSVHTLFSASVLLLASFSPVSTTSDGDGLLTLTETYLEKKNIGFVAPMGGSSHITWVLTILDELAERGHNVTYLTKDGSMRFGKPYPRINSVSFSPEPASDIEKFFDSIEEVKNPIPALNKILTSMMATWETDFYALTDSFKSNNFNVVICDNMADVCNQAAIAAKIPFIVTATAESTSESAAPYINNHGALIEEYTTEFLSFSQRFHDKFVLPLKLIWYLYDGIKDITKRKKAIGVESSIMPTWAWKDSLKIVNSYFGMTPARPLGPLVEFVGPIIPRKYAPLNTELEEFLENHKRIAYVAFGQHATPSANTVTLILTALLEVYETGDLDGIIWAGTMAADKMVKEITTTSSATYKVENLLGNTFSDIRFVKWAPQVAVLSHPSTRVFVSHGGFGSCVEAIYTGVRTVFFPIFGDQMGNAMMLKRANIGDVLRTTTTIPEAIQKIKNIVMDEDGEVEKNLKRMQAIAQIKSRSGTKLGADLVEEVAFSSVGEKIPHRYEASRNMSFIKAHNIDIYGAFALIALGIISTLGCVSYKSVKKVISIAKSQQKMKTQ